MKWALTEALNLRVYNYTKLRLKLVNEVVLPPADTVTNLNCLCLSSRSVGLKKKIKNTKAEKNLEKSCRSQEVEETIQNNKQKHDKEIYAALGSASFDICPSIWGSWVEW